MGKYNFSLDMDSPNTMFYIGNEVDSGSSVLEFGSANGRLTKYLSRTKKCAVTIVEIDQEAGLEASNYAVTSYLGKKFGDIDNFYWLNSEKIYDYIIFADVLEHLNAPKAILEKCQEVLKDEGKILVSIPNIGHNSILIDLFNDKFDYTETGLLDSTHIHFFTYHTFQKMITASGLTILNQWPIYSRVGWNEIKNNYSDVPYSVERELRKRKSGSIYQYVFSLGKQSFFSKDKNNFEDLQPLNIESVGLQEASCYWVPVENNLYEYDRVSEVYQPKEKNTIYFPINGGVKQIRIDFIERKALIKIEKIKIILPNKEIHEVKVLSHNAKSVMDNIYFFANEDPVIELDVQSFLQIEIDGVEIIFDILDCNMDEKQMKIYAELFPLCLEKQKDWTYKQQMEKFLSEKIEATEYINHLESDVHEQQKYVNHLENDIEIQKTDISHLEKNIDEQKKYIEHLEKDIATLKAYIEGLR